MHAVLTAVALAYTVAVQNVYAYPPMQRFPTSTGYHRSDANTVRCGHLHVPSVMDHQFKNQRTDYVNVSCPSLYANAADGTDPRPIRTMATADGSDDASGIRCVKTPHCRYNAYKSFWEQEAPALKVCAGNDISLDTAVDLVMEWDIQPEPWAFKPRGRRCLHTEHMVEADNCVPGNINRYGGVITLRIVTVQRVLAPAEYDLDVWYEVHCANGDANVKRRCRYDPYSLTYKIESAFGRPCQLRADTDGYLSEVTHDAPALPMHGDHSYNASLLGNDTAPSSDYEEEEGEAFFLDTDKIVFEVSEDGLRVGDIPPPAGTHYMVGGGAVKAPDTTSAAKQQLPFYPGIYPGDGLATLRAILYKHKN